MARKFSEFDNSTSPASTDNVVGFRPGATNVNKRWTWSSVVSFLQGILDITLLNRSADNYVQVTGAGTGSAPTVAAIGSDANIDLNLTGKGIGAVIVGGALQIGDDTTVNGDFYTSGGTINTVGGNINTAGGTLNLGAGNLTMAGGLLSITGGGSIDLGGTTTISDSIIVTPILSVTTIAAGSIVATSLQSTTANIVTGTIGTLTTTSINTTGGTLFLTGTLDASAVVANDSFDSSTVNRFQFSSDLAITADVASVQGAGLLSNTINIITTCANAGDAVTLPAVGGAFPPDGWYVMIRNDGANSADVFPNTGAQVNALGANNPYALAAGATAAFFSIGNVNGDWQAFTF